MSESPLTGSTSLAVWYGVGLLTGIALFGGLIYFQVNQVLESRTIRFLLLALTLAGTYWVFSSNRELSNTGA